MWQNFGVMVKSGVHKCMAIYYTLWIQPDHLRVLTVDKSMFILHSQVYDKNSFQSISFTSLHQTQGRKWSFWWRVWNSQLLPKVEDLERERQKERKTNGKHNVVVFDHVCPNVMSIFMQRKFGVFRVGFCSCFNTFIWDPQ